MDFKPSYLNFFGIVNYIERDRSGEKQKKIIPRETITYAYLHDLIIVSLFEGSISDLEKKLLESIVRSIREEPLELKKISEIGDNQNLFSQVGKLIIDRTGYKVSHQGKEINLPRKEFELLYLLASKPGKVFKREHILESVWGKDVVVGGRTIDVHIRKLREKIGSTFFKTIKGVGYKFVV